jgi:hypothetical protein
MCQRLGCADRGGLPPQGLTQGFARRHRNATPVVIEPCEDPGRIEMHPKPNLLKAQRRDGARRGDRKPTCHQFNRIGLRHVPPSTAMGTMSLASPISPPSCRLTEVCKEGSVVWIVQVQLRAHGTLLLGRNKSFVTLLGSRVMITLRGRVRDRPLECCKSSVARAHQGEALAPSAAFARFRGVAQASDGGSRGKRGGT